MSSTMICTTSFLFLEETHLFAVKRSVIVEGILDHGTVYSEDEGESAVSGGVGGSLSARGGQGWELK